MVRVRFRLGYTMAICLVLATASKPPQLVLYSQPCFQAALYTARLWFIPINKCVYILVMFMLSSCTACGFKI